MKIVSGVRFNTGLLVDGMQFRYHNTKTANGSPLTLYKGNTTGRNKQPAYCGGDKGYYPIDWVNGEYIHQIGYKRGTYYDYIVIIIKNIDTGAIRDNIRGYGTGGGRTISTYTSTGIITGFVADFRRQGDKTMYPSRIETWTAGNQPVSDRLPNWTNAGNCG